MIHLPKKKKRKKKKENSILNVIFHIKICFDISSRIYKKL